MLRPRPRAATCRTSTVRRRRAAQRAAGAAEPDDRSRATSSARSCERLRAGSVRLLTLTGPGGVGKTRLALEAARAVEADFADGARFVSLAAVERPQDVPAAIVGALGIIAARGRVGRARRSSASWPPSICCWSSTTASTCSAPRRSSAAWRPRVPRSRCSPRAASRSPCRPSSCYPVPPLALPGARTADPEALAGVDAVALFCERARAHDPDFDLDGGNAAAVAEICRRVDGLPLAIELAAARCGLLSPGEIAERLDAALGALGAGPRDAPARQQTLRATIDWSHDLLERRRAGVLRALRGVRRRRDGRGGRGDHRRRPRHARPARRQEPARAPPAGGRAHPAADARDDPRLRRRALRGRRRRAKPSASATTATSSRWRDATGPSGRSSARAAASTSPGSTPRSTTSTPRSVGARAGHARVRARAGRGARRVLAARAIATRTPSLDRAGAAASPAPTAHPAVRVRALCKKAGRCGRSGAGPRGRRCWPRPRRSPGRWRTR